MAIGKEGGYIDKTTGYFDKVVSKVKCLKCEVEIPREHLEAVISSIEQTDSNFRKQEICEWENEVHPCEHTLTL